MITKSLAKCISFSALIVTVMIAANSCGIINRHATTAYQKHIHEAPYDVIIVPGLPFDTGKVNVLLKARMFWAKALYDQGIARHIIFSGSAVHSPYVEGQVMKIMSDSLGIPTARTFIEDRALHSTENVAYGIALARSMGFEKIAVATDPFQSFFLHRFSNKNKLGVAMLPFSIDSMPVYSKRPVPRINPTDAFIEDFVPLAQRETAGQ